MAFILPILAVGAPIESSGSTGIGGNQLADPGFYWAAGGVYFFTRDITSWSQQSYVKSGNTNRNDRFGFSVSISGDGNVLAVGAYNEDSAATGIGGDQSDNTATSSGAVYLY